MKNLTQKHLVASVESDCDTDITSFVAILDKEDITNILDTAEIAQKKNILVIEFEYAGAVWAQGDPSSMSISEDHHLAALVLEALEFNPARFVADTVRVYKDRFDFAAYPKHGTDEQLHYTKSFPLDVLTSQNPVAVAK